jgi:hypothetical protein
LLKSLLARLWVKEKEKEISTEVSKNSEVKKNPTTKNSIRTNRGRIIDEKMILTNNNGNDDFYSLSYLKLGDIKQTLLT